MNTHRMILLLMLAIVSCCCTSLIPLLNLSPLESGTPAPELILPNTAGTQVSLSSFEGYIVLLNFWTPT